MRPSDRILRKLGIKFVAEQAGISEYVLKRNLLKILLAPDVNARSVTIVQHIHVGSRHEGAGNAGYAHLLEHMLFKGTPTHNSDNGNSYDEFVMALGNNVNATTSNDMTNFFAQIPVHAAGEYFEHEADRLRHANLFDPDLKSEMPVVLKEFEQSENDAGAVLHQLLWAMAFTEHQYKMDTIGSKSELRNVTAKSLKERLYDVFYWPNNTTLIVVGGDAEEMLRNVARAYGSLPPSPHAIPKPYTIEPAQFGERRYLVNKPGDLPQIAIGYHVPEADHEDHYALAALASLLGGSAASRLFQRFVDRGIMVSAWASMQELHDPGLFEVGATLPPDLTTASAERKLLKEIEWFKTHLVSAKALTDLKERNANGTLMSRSSQMGWAHTLSNNEAVSDWRWGTAYDDNYDKVTAADIQRVAQRYLTADNRTVGHFVPTTQAQAQGDDAVQVRTDIADDDLTPRPMRLTKVPAKPSNSKALSFAQQTKKIVLPNGLTLLLMPQPSEKPVGLSLRINAGYDQSNGNRMLARLTAAMLTYGSVKYSKKRIQQLTAKMLASFGFAVQDVSMSLNTLIPPKNLPLLLDMLADALIAPKFDPEDLEVLKEGYTSYLQQENEDPDNRAYQAATQMLYEPGHSLYQQGFAESNTQLAAITVQDLHSFKQKVTPQGSVIAIVGPFDAQAVTALVEAKFGKWTGGQAHLRQPVASAISVRGLRRDIHIEGKDSVSIVIGLPCPLSQHSPDYMAALVANRALGGDTLKSRLGWQIRERRGLTYGVYSYFADDTFGGAPWLTAMQTDRANIERAVQLIGSITKQYVKDGISDVEFEVEKQTLAAAFSISLDSPDHIARVLCAAEYTGVGSKAIDDFDDNLQALSKDEVNAAIRKYFQVDNCVTVVAGSLLATNT